MAVDTGAESLLARRPDAVDLVTDSGLGALLGPPTPAPALVVARGRLRPLPARQVMGVPADLGALRRSGVLSPQGLARAAAERFLPREALDADVAVGSYLAERFGRELVEGLVEPLLGGVYAGYADELSLAMVMPQLSDELREPGSVTAAVQRLLPPSDGSGRPAFVGIHGGLGCWPQALAALSGAEVVTGRPVTALRQVPEGWELVSGDHRAPAAATYDGVVLAVPGPAAARLLVDAVPVAARGAERVPYASVAVVTFAFGPTSGLATLPRGTGFLVPPAGGGVIKAATFSTAKWEWLREAAGGLTIVRVSVGRFGDEAVLQREDSELAAMALADLAWRLEAPVPLPVDQRVDRWGGGLPQYLVGHRERVARARDALPPTLALAGAAYDGVGIPACIASGRTAARGLLTTLLARQRQAGQ